MACYEQHTSPATVAVTILVMDATSKESAAEIWEVWLPYVLSAPDDWPLQTCCGSGAGLEDGK